MSLLTLNPPPGQYTHDVTVTVSGPPGVNIISTSDGSEPVFVKTVVASDNYSPPIPYVQTIEDGRGRAIFDGSFPKYYNSNWQAQGSPTNFNALNPDFKFLYNAWNFLRQGGTRVLVLGDRSLTDGNPPTYRIKGDGGADFRITITSLASLMGLSVTIKDRSDYSGGMLNPTYEELMSYDMLFVLSSYANDPPVSNITLAGAANIAQARRNGLGIYICTDHYDFYGTANAIVGQITDGNFSGNYDFTPGTTVGYNKSTFGDSPLFDGLNDSDVLTGDGSNSSINQDIATPETLPTTVNITTGYTQLKFAVVDSNGNVTFEQYGYSVSVPPIIVLTDENADEITELPTSISNEREVYFRFDATAPGQKVSGFVKVGDTVIGTFNDNEEGLINVNWLDTIYSDSARPNIVKMPLLIDQDIVVEIFDPLVFVYTFKFNRVVPELGKNPLDFYRALRITMGESNELSIAKLLGDIIRQYPNIVFSTNLPVYLKNVRQYMTDVNSLTDL